MRRRDVPTADTPIFEAPENAAARSPLTVMPVLARALSKGPTT
jgi:hypothetical protein